MHALINSREGVDLNHEPKRNGILSTVIANTCMEVLFHVKMTKRSSTQVCARHA